MAAKLAGPGAGGRYAVEANSEINVTPFVDVMLVLLIIFMVAAPLATPSVEVDLPNAVAPPATNPPIPVYITLTPGGGIFIGNTQSSAATLSEDLRNAIPGRSPERERIFIRGDKDVIYRDFMDLMNGLQDNGFYSVALVGLDQG